MKKIIRLIRGLFVLIGWTGVFIFLSNLLTSIIWNFNFMSSRSWDILSAFWNQGGVIKTISDVILITILLTLPLFWLIGYILVLKLNYTKILLYPINLIYNVFTPKTNKEPERIVIKNIKSSQQMVDDIKAEIDSLKPEKSKEAGNLRSEINKKLSDEIKN